MAKTVNQVGLNVMPAAVSQIMNGNVASVETAPKTKMKLSQCIGGRLRKKNGIDGKDQHIEQDDDVPPIEQQVLQVAQLASRNDDKHADR
ncbi:MAG TPA: hypothetical protein VI137_11880 [Pseudolabrys sp.]